MLLHLYRGIGSSLIAPDRCDLGATAAISQGKDAGPDRSIGLPIALSPSSATSSPPSLWASATISPGEAQSLLEEDAQMVADCRGALGPAIGSKAKDAAVFSHLDFQQGHTRGARMKARVRPTTYRQSGSPS